MKSYAEKKYAENENPNRAKYTPLGNNCGTFARDVIAQDESVDNPTVGWPTPPNKSGTSVDANLIRWTEEITPGNEPATGRVFKQLHSLDSLGLKIDSLINHSKIKEIPDQSEIEGWRQGLDGTTYMIEYRTDSVYYFKWYWTPGAYQHIKEGVMVKQFIDSIMAIVETPQDQQQFTASIPFQCWTNGGISTACKVLTRTQLKKYRRERTEYRRAAHMQKPQ